jgi:hypothetical protein
MEEEKDWILDTTDIFSTQWVDDQGRTRKRKWRDGSCCYYDEEGQRHRLDGPARQYDQHREWFYHGQEIPCTSQQEFERWLKLKAFW